MKAILRRSLCGIALVMGVASSHAAFVNFIEAANEVDPVTVETDLLAHPGVALISSLTAEGGIVTGFHTPAISPAPVLPGKYAAVLFEPGVPSTAPQLVSDVVLVTALAIATDDNGGTFQDLIVGFLSADIALGDLLATLDREGYSFMGGIVEDGTLQDVLVLDDALTVRVLSDAGTPELPEPGGLLLVGAALVALGAARRRAVPRA